MERHFDYKPKWIGITLCALFFGAGAIVLGTQANGNERGLIINGIVELSPRAAAVLLWVLTALSTAFVVLAGFLAIMCMMLHQRIAFTDEYLVIPRSRWSTKDVTVPFREVLELSTSEVWGQRFLKIVHQWGTFTLAASMLPKKDDFDEICDVVSRRVKECARDESMER